MTEYETERTMIQSATGLTLRWVMSSEGLRMQWIRECASSDDRIVFLLVTPQVAIQLAAA